jgi:hypothetical protein
MCTIVEGSGGLPIFGSTRQEGNGKFDAVPVACFSSDQSLLDLKDVYHRMELRGEKFGRAVA